MKSEIKTKLVAALRSGDYVQGSGRLMAVDRRGEKTFCCLGVLCSVMGVEWRNHTFENEFCTPIVSITPFLGDVCLKKKDGDEYLNQSALESIELTSKQQNHLAVLNDNGQSFEEIADYIEIELDCGGMV